MEKINAFYNWVSALMVSDNCKVRIDKINFDKNISEDTLEIGNVLNKQYWNNTDNIIKKTFEVYTDLMPSIEIPAETTVSESPY